MIIMLMRCCVPALHHIMWPGTMNRHMQGVNLCRYRQTHYCRLHCATSSVSVPTSPPGIGADTSMGRVGCHSHNQVILTGEPADSSSAASPKAFPTHSVKIGQNFCTPSIMLYTAIASCSLPYLVLLFWNMRKAESGAACGRVN